MRKKFVFATNNSHKLEEVTAILGEKVELLSMKDIKCDTDIPETADTLEGNALLKARYIFDNYHLDCFADDTGLEVEALGGAPVYIPPVICRRCTQFGSKHEEVAERIWRASRTVRHNSVPYLYLSSTERNICLKAS